MQQQHYLPALKKEMYAMDPYAINDVQIAFLSVSIVKVEGYIEYCECGWVADNSPVLQSARPPCGWLRRGQNAHCIMGKCRQTNAAQDTK